MANGNIHLIFGARCDSNLGEFPLGLDCLTGDADVGELTSLIGDTIQTGGEDWPVWLEFGFLSARRVVTVHHDHTGWTYSYKYENQILPGAVYS